MTGTLERRAENRPGDRGSAHTGVVTLLCGLLAVLAVAGSVAGMLVAGGPGREVVETARGASVTLYGEGLYAADTVLVGAGNRGQDMAILLVEVPVLILAVLWFRRRGGPLPTAVLAGVLSFFAYFYASMVFATAQNRLFPLYVGAAASAAFALVVVARRADVAMASAALPDRPGHRALGVYLASVAAALTAAWLPQMTTTAVRGDVAAVVGPYTSAVTEALDLGVVVPVVVLAAVLVFRGHPGGRGLALVLLVLNVCIGVVLIGQGASQLLLDVPLTTGEILGKMLSFALLTLVAGGLLMRMAVAARSPVDTAPDPEEATDLSRPPPSAPAGR